MAASNYKLSIEQGATFEFLCTFKAGTPAVPVDLTGYTARMHVRKKVGAAEALLQLTTENGRIELGGTAGTIRLKLTAVETAALDWTVGVYDLELVAPAGTVRRLLKGTVVVSPEVTT